MIPRTLGILAAACLLAACGQPAETPALAEPVENRGYAPCLAEPVAD